MRLECVRRYSSSAGAWDVGQVIDVDDDLGAWLMRDDPAAFQILPPAKQIDAPPVDKAVKSPPRSKSTRRRSTKDV